MSVLQSIILGIIQGIAEFLPISSSGHLVIVQSFMDINPPLLYDILLHAATLAAIIIVFRKSVWKLLKGFFLTVFRKGDDEDRVYFRAALFILFASVFTAGLGFIIDRFDFKEVPKLTCVFFLVTAAVLFISRKFQGEKTLTDLNLKNSWKDGLVIGIAQGISALPGISRSGITISFSLFRGISREAAGELSFLLSIPVIAGAAAIKLLKDSAELSAAVDAPAMAAGLISAFIFGLISLILLIRLVKKGKLYYFGFYLIPAAVVSFILL